MNTTRDEVLAQLASWERVAVAGSDASDEQEREYEALYRAMVPHLVRSADAGDVWQAVDDALLAGRLLGWWERRCLERTAVTTSTINVLLDTYPDANAGRRSRRANPDGRTPQGPAEDALRQLVRNTMDKHPRINRMRACEIVRADLYKSYMLTKDAAQREGRKQLRPEERLPSVARMYKRTQGVRRTPKK
jgi:hypothetical protein